MKTPKHSFNSSSKRAFSYTFCIHKRKRPEYCACSALVIWFSVIGVLFKFAVYVLVSLLKQLCHVTVEHLTSEDHLPHALQGEKDLPS